MLKEKIVKRKQQQKNAITKCVNARQMIFF